MNQDVIKQLKWAICAVAAGGIAYFAIPIVAKLALDLVTIALCGVAMLGIWIFLPALSEAFAQLSYRLWELSIRADPIAKCKRNIIIHAAGIQTMETNIGQAISAVAGLRRELKDPSLTKEDRDEWNQQITMMETSIGSLKTLRDEAIALHTKMESEVKRAEAKMRVGKAFKSLLSVFAFNQTDGKEAMAARIALDQVDKQLSDSTANLQVILSRQMTNARLKTAIPLTALPSGERV